ncbi:serine hydrolase [Streptomyces massasporeus]|uniref:serine hydrolase n=1 Tax=Streptomyces massasporeus TaxID=67324 RepID=UPI00339EBED4
MVFTLLLTGTGSWIFPGWIFSAEGVAPNEWTPRPRHKAAPATGAGGDVPSSRPLRKRRPDATCSLPPSVRRSTARGVGATPARSSPTASGTRTPSGRARTSSTPTANLVLLGLVIEKVTGRKLADILHERVLRPAGPRHTLFPQDDEFPERPARLHRPDAQRRGRGRHRLAPQPGLGGRGDDLGPARPAPLSEGRRHRRTAQPGDPGTAPEDAADRLPRHRLRPRHLPTASASSRPTAGSAATARSRATRP